MPSDTRFKNGPGLVWMLHSVSCPVWLQQARASNHRIRGKNQSLSLRLSVMFGFKHGLLWFVHPNLATQSLHIICILPPPGPQRLPRSISFSLQPVLSYKGSLGYRRPWGCNTDVDSVGIKANQASRQGDARLSLDSACLSWPEDECPCGPKSHVALCETNELFAHHSNWHKEQPSRHLHTPSQRQIQNHKGRQWIVSATPYKREK